ncbi:alanyl-tRNA editing protein [Candidatus Micrarchaeota archaeon]|nr:alanyl-tRNA editing protein [Candidatus Micrarchaeota archaeon]
MTIPFYLQDSYLRECDAIVQSVSGKEIVLDQTIFYPRGGGQPTDTGKIIISASGSADPHGVVSVGVGASDVVGDNANEFRVINVMKKEGKIIHELDRDAGFGVGAKVKCVLDWERRYKLMRMHTAAHVLGATMFNELGVLITGNQLDLDKTRFDFSLESFDRAKFEEVVGKANGFLAAGAELKIYDLPRDEAMKIPGVVKLAGALPPSITVLRIVEIPGLDIQADGGTHVKSLKEVGKIGIIKLENKGKENRRIYFTLSG